MPKGPSAEAVVKAATDVYAFKGQRDDIRHGHGCDPELKVSIILASAASGNSQHSIALALGYSNNKPVSEVLGRRQRSPDKFGPPDVIIEEIIAQAADYQRNINNQTSVGRRIEVSDKIPDPEPPEVMEMRSQIARGDKLLRGLISSDGYRESSGHSVA